jgi:hypothetical protein
MQTTQFGSETGSLQETQISSKIDSLQPPQFCCEN